jgi:peptide/histidine transporter 3/4
MIKGSSKANILLPNSTKPCIKYALYSPEFQRNLLSFKDIRANSYHIETIDEDKK